MSFNFCKTCENMLFSKIHNNKLQYYCRYCGDEENDIIVNKCLYNVKHYNSNYYKFYNNHELIYDPTLPRLKTIKCINDKCITNTSKKESNIIFIKYNYINMKYLYICTECKSSWKNK